MPYQHDKNDGAGMTDKEKILAFGEMVEAAEKLSAPWRKAFIISNIAHVLVELFLAILLGMMIYFAYMEPVDYGMEQGQNYNDQTQSQTYHFSESGD